jgi:hypothetical protein
MKRALCSLLLVACGASSIEAPRGAHPANDAVAVPYPPPPAKVEELPPRPAPQCVWTDGYWEFTDRWEWQAGEWVLPPAHCRLAPVELRRQGGQLLHARPRWYPDNVTLLGVQSACPPPSPCSGISSTNSASTGPGR